MRSRAALPFVLILAIVEGAAAQSPQRLERTTTAFRGPCEASAALPLGSGMFVVADDDKKDLRVYRMDHAGEPKKIETSKLPGLEETDDLEGGAQIGDTLYWTTSHSSTKNGKAKPGRRLFFAVRIDPASLTATPVGKPYTRLLDDLQGDARYARYKIASAAGLPAEAPGALNIEGLAATPDDKLLIGFRSPALDGKALIATLNNPDGVINGQPAVFGDPVDLDLGGLGIRSLEYWPDDKTYAILAGPSGASGQFRIFRWPGKAGDKPTPMDDVDLTGLIPEALFFNGDELFVLSDDGDFCPEDEACRAFRAASFKLATAPKN